MAASVLGRCGDEHDVEAADVPRRTGEPAQQVGVRGAAEAVCAALAQLDGVDVGQDVGVAGEGDDGTPAGRIGRQHVDGAVAGRERPLGGGVEDVRQRMAGGVQPRTRSR